jgi:hypothetical protein
MRGIRVTPEEDGWRLLTNIDLGITNFMEARIKDVKK